MQNPFLAERAHFRHAHFRPRRLVFVLNYQYGATPMHFPFFSSRCPPIPQTRAPLHHLWHLLPIGMTASTKTRRLVAI
jgi:hypothetical protein